MSGHSWPERLKDRIYFDPWIGVSGDQTSLEANLTQIFAKNEKSLHKVKLYPFPFIRPSWFKNCPLLASFLISVYEDGGNPTLVLTAQDLTSCSSTLKELKFDTTHIFDFRWLENCHNLDSLHIIAREGRGKLDMDWRLPPLPLKKLKISFVDMDQECQEEVLNLVNRSANP